MPETARDVAQAISRAAGVPIGLAATAVNAALNFGIAPMTFHWQGLDRVSPMLHWPVLADTGQRKTAAFNYAFNGLKRADESVEIAWHGAKQQYNDDLKALKKQKGYKKGDTPPPPWPVKYAPTQLLRDSTIEGVLRHAQSTKRFGLYNDEGATLYSGWNMGGGAQRMMTVQQSLHDTGEYNLKRTSEGGKDWSGRRCCFTSSIGIQVGLGVDLFTSRAGGQRVHSAANGVSVGA